MMTLWLSVVHHFLDSDNLFNKAAIIEQIRNEYKLDSMKGNLPNKWPDGLEDFLKDLDAMPMNAFSH